MPIQLTEDIAKRLRAARKAAGFKAAKDFATQHDIPLSTYSQHETGKRSINAELIINYSSNFNINPCWLLTGSGEPFFDADQKDKKAIIERETFTISHKVNDDHSHGSGVDLALMKRILLAAGPLFEDKACKISYEGLVNRCFDIYDAVSTLSADTEEKDKIIHLTLSAIKTKE